MRYRLRTLLVLSAIGPPILAWGYANREAFESACGWAGFVAFFVFWDWMAQKSESYRYVPGERENAELPVEQEWYMR
jgi:hypothetical protein